MIKSYKFKRYNAELNTNPCNAYNNANLTLTLRLNVQQVNPAGGAATGTHKDASGKPRNIVKWPEDKWKAWKYHFFKSAQDFWSGGFWLYNNCGGFAFRQRGEIYLPNIYCLLNIVGSSPRMISHHTIDVVNLASDVTGLQFRSHARLYDSEDLKRSTARRDSKGKSIYQTTQVHEIGHLLGMGHVDIGKAHCPTNKDTNDPLCYGVSDSSLNSVMGAGMQKRDSNAAPWITAMKHFDSDLYASKIYLPPKKRFVAGTAKWLVERQRIYPSTSAEYEAKKKIFRTPQR